MRGYDPRYSLGIAAAFIKYKEKFLLTFDPKFGFWRVPGGRMVKRESPEETIIREMKEELGLRVKVEKFLGFGRDFVYVKPEKRMRSRCILYFLTFAKTNKIRPLKSEVAKIKWVSFQELKRTKLLEPAMIDLFQRFPKFLVRD